jgi:hypothetical protein
MFCTAQGLEVAGCCEHGNEPSGSIQGGKFLDQLSYYQILIKDSDPWGKTYYFSSEFIHIEKE